MDQENDPIGSQQQNLRWIYFPDIGDVQRKRCEKLIMNDSSLEEELRGSLTREASKFFVCLFVSVVSDVGCTYLQCVKIHGDRKSVV